MDLLSALGLLLGLAAIALGQYLEGGQLAALAQPTAAVIVIGGTLGATLLSIQAADLRRGLRMLKNVLRPPPDRSEQIARSLAEFAQLARKDGIVALEEPVGRTSDPFVRTALRHVIDGTPGPILHDILHTEVDGRAEDARAGIRVFEVAGGYAPTLGILGAVLGLIHVMENLEEPAQLGAGIAVAFVATIYGVGLANLVLLPVAARLRRIAAIERECEEMVIEGALAIEGGNGPRAVEQRLRAFLRPR